MTDHSRQDRTRSPRPNELANLYRYEMEIEQAGRIMRETLRKNDQALREVRAAIKRACGDRETI